LNKNNQIKIILRFFYNKSISLIFRARFKFKIN